MSWHGITGHDEIVARFRRALGLGRLASTFLFVGPAGIGKRAFAIKLAQTLLCQTRPAALLDPCEECAGCHQVLAGTHPDLELISKPADKSVIPVERFIGPPERRMQEGLCHNISLKPFMGGRRIAIINDADYLAAEGANALLKTLEEPPPKSVLILIGTTADKQLPTIRSRCQIVRFQPLAPDVIAQLLAQQGRADQAEALRLARFSEGSLERAAELADPVLWEFRARLLEALSQAPLDAVRIAPAVTVFVEEAGREAPPRRARMRLLIGFALEFYRQVLRAISGVPPAEHDELNAAAQAVADRGNVDADAADAAVLRCLEALEHIDRNANQASLLECWLDDLSQITSGRAPSQVHG